MILKLGMDRHGLEVYKVYINDDPGLTLTYYTAKSNLVNLAYFAFAGPRCQVSIYKTRLYSNKLGECQKS